MFYNYNFFIITKGGQIEIQCQITGSEKAEWERHDGQMPLIKRESQTGNVHKLM